MNKTKEMNLQDITTWTVTADHKARPKNPHRCTDGTYVSCVNLPDGPNCDGCNAYIKFEQGIKEHTYAYSETLLPGDYPAEDVELVWQYKYPDLGTWLIEYCMNDYESFQDYSDSITQWGFITRQYLQLKQPVKEQGVIYLDINDFSISETDLERAFCFGYLANPENNPLDNTEMMRRYEVFKTEYLTPMISRKGITD